MPENQIKDDIEFDITVIKQEIEQLQLVVLNLANQVAELVDGKKE